MGFPPLNNTAFRGIVSKQSTDSSLIKITQIDVQGADYQTQEHHRESVLGENCETQIIFVAARNL